MKLSVFRVTVQIQEKYKIPRGGKMKFTVVKKGLYYDSVKLMLVTNKLLELD